MFFLVEEIFIVMKKSEFHQIYKKCIPFFQHYVCTSNMKMVCMQLEQSIIKQLYLEHAILSTVCITDSIKFYQEQNEHYKNVYSRLMMSLR